MPQENATGIGTALVIATKSRAGCEQCKRRKVKCDERKPTCSTCLRRGEICTGNFTLDAWQMERPWVAYHRDLAPASAALENDILRHWYDETCLNMALFRPPVNPLSHSLSVWLRYSKALRHTLECVAEAHRRHFVPATLAQALELRELAIISLRGEVGRVQASCSKRQQMLTTTVLSSLILSVSAGWFDPSGTDFGLEFLLGVHPIIHELVEHPNPFSFYAIGLYLYWDAFTSYLVPTCRQCWPRPAILDALQRPPFSTNIHPVTGIAITLCPLVAESGRFYRRVVDLLGSNDVATLAGNEGHDIETRLRRWRPPDGMLLQAQLVQLAEGYRYAGIIMLYQAKATMGTLSQTDSQLLHSIVHKVMQTMEHVPDNDPLLNWVGPLLVIAGSELSAEYVQERSVVERTACRVAQWTRVSAHRLALDLIKSVWELRDREIRTSWLELMLCKGMALALG